MTYVERIYALGDLKIVNLLRLGAVRLNYTDIAPFLYMYIETVKPVQFEYLKATCLAYTRLS